MPTILVQMSDPSWTKQAMHLACSAARYTGYPLVLLRLMKISNPALLGSGIVTEAPSWSQYAEIDEYARIADEYDVLLTLQPMNYASLTDALVQAAEHAHAVVCFAHIAPSRLRWLHHMRVWPLQHQLERIGCQLQTLESATQGENSVAEMIMHPVR